MFLVPTFATTFPLWLKSMCLFQLTPRSYFLQPCSCTDWLNEWSKGIKYPLHVLVYPAHMTFVFITLQCRNESNSSRCVCMCTSIPLSIRAYTSRSRGIRDIIYKSNSFITTAQKQIHLFFLHPWTLMFSSSMDPFLIALKGKFTVNSIGTKAINLGIFPMIRWLCKVKIFIRLKTQFTWAHHPKCVSRSEVYSHWCQAKSENTKTFTTQMLPKLYFSKSPDDSKRFYALHVKDWIFICPVMN